MKAKTIKNKILLSVVLFGLACISLLAGWALQTKKVSAAESQTGITFVEGASVRIDTDGETSGIRFSARFGKEIYDKIYDEQGNNRTGAELGMIIAPHSYVEGVTPTDWFAYFKDEYDMEKSQISMRFSSNKVIDKGTGVYQVNGAMVKVKYNNWDRDFRAILYYTTDNGATYIYQVNEDARSVTDISIAAIQKESERADGDYKDNELSVLYNYADGNIPRVVYDASKDAHQGKLTQGKIGTDEKDTKALVEQVDINGTEWFKYTIQELGTTPAIGLSYSVDGVDLQQYDYVYFKVMSNRTGTQCDLCSTDLTYAAGNWNELTANQPFEVVMDCDQFMDGAKNGMYLAVKDLEVGDEIYISSFVAHGAKSVSYMIDGLPQEGYISVSERGEVCTTDKYHDALSSTAKEQVRNQAELEISKTLPIVVYEAGVDNDKFKKLTVDENGTPITVDGGAPEGDTDAFKFEKTPIQINETMYAWVYTYTLTGKENLDIYDFVTFNAWTNGAEGMFVVSTGMTEEDIVFRQNITAEPTDIALGKDDFVSGANGQLMIAFLSASADATFYMSDVIAMGATSLNGMIDRLAEQTDSDMTASDQVSLADINNFVSILETTTGKTISYDSKQNLLRTEGRPYNVVDTTAENATGRFIPIALEDDGDGWKAEITQVREVGLNWFKITVTQKGKNGVLAYKLNTDAEDIDMNLSGYKMIALKFRVDGLSGLLSGGNGMGITIATEGEDTDQKEATKNLAWSADGMLQLTPLISYNQFAFSPNELFTMFDKGYLVLSGLGVGESIYISDFICYNLYTAMTMIENLPDESSLQESDYNAVKKVRAYLDQLSKASNETFADVAAMEAYAAESEKIEAAFSEGYIQSLSDKFQAIEDYFTAQNIIPLLPAGDPTSSEAFVSVPVQADGVVGWSGTTESVTMDGENWIKMSIEEIGTNRTLYFKLNLLDYITDTESIDYVAFTIKSTNPNATLGMSVGETDGTISNSADFLEEGESVVLGENGYTFKMDFAGLALLGIIVEYIDVSYTYKVTGLEVGDKVYVSSVKAYQKTYTSAIVDKLPLASTISVEEILDYKEQIDLTRAEVDGSSGLDLTNLKALEFKLFKYYLGLLPDLDTTKLDPSSYKLEEVKEYVEALKNIRKYYAAFREKSTNTIYDNLEKLGGTEAEANKWLNNETIIFSILLHKIDTSDGVANGEYVVTVENVSLVEDAMSCYVELKGHKTKGSTMQWVQTGSGLFNGTFQRVEASYADGALTNEQKSLVIDLYRQALQAYVNALPVATEITLNDEAAILATREWLLARQDLASNNGCDYRTANQLLGERENALLQLYINDMDPSNVTRDSEVDIAKVRAYYTLLRDTYGVSVNVNAERLLACEVALLSAKLAIMPTVDEITINDLKAAERVYLSAINLMNEADVSLEVIDLTVAAAQLFIQVVQLQLDSLPLPEQLDRNSLIKYQGIQALVEEVKLLVPNPEWVLDMSHAMPSFLAATYLYALNNLDEEPTDSFDDKLETEKALQAFLNMIEYDASLATKVETDILYKNVMALLKYYWKNLPTFDVTSEDYQNYDLIGTGYYTNMQNARWLYDLMYSYGFNPDSLVNIDVLLNYEKLLLKNYIDTLPEVSAVTMANADSIRNTRELYDRLQAANVDVSEIWTNEQMQAYESALELASALTSLREKIANLDILSCTTADLQALREECQAKADAGYDVSSITADLENLEYEWVMMSAMQSIFYEVVGKDSMQPLGDAYAYMQESMIFNEEFVQEVALYTFITLRLQIQNLPEAEEVTPADGEKIAFAKGLYDMLTQAGIPLEEMLEQEYQDKLNNCYTALNNLAA